VRQRICLVLIVCIFAIALTPDQRAIAQDAAATIPISSSGSFDQLITFDGAVDDFSSSFARAASIRFNTLDALDSITRKSFQPEQLPSVLKTGIARHILFTGSRLRIDDLNSNHSYIIDCADSSVVDLDHTHALATRTALPSELMRWVQGNPLSLRTVPPKALAPMHRTIFSDGVQFTIDASAAPGTVTDTFAYRYDSKMPELSCDVLDSSRAMLIAGPFSPLTNLHMYMEEFNKKGETLSGYGLIRIANEGDNFSREDFLVGTLGHFRGSIVRDNFSTKVDPAAFAVPATYRVVSVDVQDSRSHLPP
jgi:hypothetical protein